MTFQLSYRQGTIARTENYSSILGAVGRAGVMIDAEGCSDFKIEKAGVVVMSDEQIVEACLSVTSILHTGHMPPSRMTADKTFPPDPHNKGRILGWVVFRQTPWVFRGIHPTREEAHKAVLLNGDGYESCHASLRAGTDDFIRL